MKTVTASTKRFIILMMALMITASVSAQQHMTFDGVPINGKVETFTKRLVAANYKNHDAIIHGDWCPLKGKPKGMYGLTVGLKPYSDEGNVYGLEILLGKNAAYYDRIKAYFEKLYPTAEVDDKMYIDIDDYKNREKTYIRQCSFSVSGKGLIRMWSNHNGDLSIEIIDEYNSNKYDPDLFDNGRIIPLPGIPKINNCLITYNEFEKDMITGEYDGQTFYLNPSGDDSYLIDWVLAGKEPIADRDAILSAYIISVLQEVNVENTVITTRNRLEPIRKRYQELQAQKLQEQQHKQKIEMIQAGILMYLIKGMFSKTNEKDIPPTGNDKIQNPDKYNNYYYGR